MKSGSVAEHAALLALLQAQPENLSWPEITAAVLEAGSAIEVWDRLVPPALLAVPGEVSPVSAALELGRWAAEGHRLVTILDAEYPGRLRCIQPAPPAFFAAGDVVADDIAVSVVGSREASARGIEIARELARELVARKVTVVSGLAPGIDTAAHRAALDAGGRTVAVIGTSINRTYLAENRELRAEIAARGLLLSQFWSNAPAQRQSFLMRNTAMSGYGLATVVVEAGEYSRARSQARMAVEHGRRVILPAQVVAQNQWARSLLGRPGVYLTRSVNSSLDLADHPSVLDVVDYVVECERERLVADAGRDHDSGHIPPSPSVSQS